MKGGLRIANTDGGGQKYPPTRHEETKRGLRTANTDEGGQKHAPTKDKETKEGWSEDSKHRGRAKAHTN